MNRNNFGRVLIRWLVNLFAMTRYWGQVVEIMFQVVDNCFFPCQLNHKWWRCIAHKVLPYWDILSRVENLKNSKTFIKIPNILEFNNSSWSIRSNGSQMFFKIGVPEITKFKGKRLCWSLFLIKLQVFGRSTLLKKLQHSSFPVKFANF